LLIKLFKHENYDLLRTDMIRCKNVKGFDIYNPVYGTIGKCTDVSASDSDQTIKASKVFKRHAHLNAIVGYSAGGQYRQ